MAECQALEAPPMSRDTRAACTVYVPFSSYRCPPRSLLQPSRGLVSSADEQIVRLTDRLVPETEAPARPDRWCVRQAARRQGLRVCSKRKRGIVRMVIPIYTTTATPHATTAARTTTLRA